MQWKLEVQALVLRAAQEHTCLPESSLWRAAQYETHQQCLCDKNVYVQTEKKYYFLLSLPFLRPKHRFTIFWLKLLVYTYLYAHSEVLTALRAQQSIQIPRGLLFRHHKIQMHPATPNAWCLSKNFSTWTKPVCITNISSKHFLAISSVAQLSFICVLF